MTVEEYLKTCPIDLKSIAALMYPTNKAAGSYLSKKLKGERPFTKDDTDKAILALVEIGAEWNKIDGFPKQEPEFKLPDHENIRGAEYYK